MFKNFLKRSKRQSLLNAGSPNSILVDLEINKTSQVAIELQKLQDVNLAISSYFSSLFGQQNHPEIRLLPYATKQVISKLLNESLNKYLQFYKNYNPKLLGKFKENGFIVMNDLLSRSSARSIKRYFDDINECCAWHVYDNAK